VAEPTPDPSWAALAARGLLPGDLSPEAFAVLRAYAGRLAADGLLADPWDLLCPGVVRTTPDAARRLAATVPAPAPAPAPAPEPDPEPAPSPGPFADAVLAPLLAGHARWARRMLGAGPVYGLMRDGGLLADAFATATPGAVGRRLWLSRRLCLVAALAGPDDREGLVNLLVRARGHPPRLAEAAAELGVADEGLPAGLDPDTPLAPAGLSPFLDWLATGPRRAGVAARITVVRAGILRHLRAEGALDGPTLALLDVGYAATVQTALTRLLAAEGIGIPLRGAYLVTSPGAVWAHRAGGSARGFLADFGAPTDFAATVLRYREVIEALLAPGDGPLLGHGPDGEPLTGPPVLPAGQRAAVADVQRAALAVVAALPPGVEPSAAAARVLVRRLLTAPTADEAARIGGWLYDDPATIGPPRRLAAVAVGLPDPAALPDAPRDLVLWPAAAAMLRSGRV
jgi:hypothetical protein